MFESDTSSEGAIGYGLNSMQRTVAKRTAGLRSEFHRYDVFVVISKETMDNGWKA